MDLIVYKDAKECVSDIINNYFKTCKEEYPVVTIVADYDRTVRLIPEIVKHDIPIENIEIASKCSCGYDKEFITSVDDLGLWVEPAWHKKNEYCEAGYITTSSPYMFVHSDCNAKVLEINEDPDVKIIEFCFEDELDFFEDKYSCCKKPDKDCEKTSCKKTASSKKPKREFEVSYCEDSEELHGFTASKTSDDFDYTFSYYTSDALSKKELEKLIKDVWSWADIFE